jgi:hypothetical protein
MALQGTGQISLLDIATEFGGTAPHSLSEFYDAAGGIPASGEITMADFYGTSAFAVPTGLIVPYIGGATPAGWSTFSSADGKTVIGAGSTYSAGSTGGSTSISASATLESAGSHTGPGAASRYGNTYSGFWNATAGAHTHTVTLTGSGDPTYRRYKFIKAGSGVEVLPANALMLGVSSLSPLSNVDNTVDAIMQGGSTPSTGGSSTVALSGSSSSAGSHIHTSGTNYNYSGYPYTRRPDTAGSHNHNASATLTWNLQRIYCTAWTNASSEFALESGGGIAMWESATPPDGWSICDGTGTTPDMRDYFVQIGTTGNHGTTAGSNSHTFNGSGGGDWTHGHGSTTSGGDYPITGDYHADANINHSHAISGSVSQLPAYYGLYFVQYQG